MKKIITLILISSLVMLNACQNKPASTSSEKEDLTIKTSIYPLQYFAERIGGDFVKVSTLLPSGADAHTFEPTPKDMIAIAESDLFIYNGLGMESYSSKISESLKGEETFMLEATKGVDVISSSHDHEDENGEISGERETGHDHSDDTHTDGDHKEKEGTSLDSEDSHEDETHDESNEESSNNDTEHSGDSHEEHGDYDPHVWLDPKRSEKLAANVRDALVELRPEEKEYFEKNYKDLQKDLDALHHDFKEILEGKENPEILVSHAAYGYWEDTYGIEQLAVAGLSPTDEPSQKELKNIIEKAREHQIKHVIFEQNVTPRIAGIVQNEINAEPLQIHNLSVLTEKDIKENNNYLTLMKENIDTIEKALENK